MPTALTIWEMDVASKPWMENSSKDAFNISCFVFPFSTFLASRMIF